MVENKFTVKKFQDYLDEEKIMGSNCVDCDTIFLPPRPVCTNCGSNNLEWIQLEGQGKITAYTTIFVPLTEMKEKCPYTVGVIELKEGPSISGLITGVTEGEQIEVGKRVKARFIRDNEKNTLCFQQI